MSLEVEGPCDFCRIANRMTDTEILYEDEYISVFRDISPATRFHVLTVPKKHIKDVTYLSADDLDLVLKMVYVAKLMLVKHGFKLDEATFGYHWPPFPTIRHLHLHTVAPTSEMGPVSRMVFKVDSYWFVSPEYLAAKLQSYRI